MISIDEGGELRIQNACIRINREIFLVGSRASQTAHAYSDFDYIIPGLKSREWQKIKNSLPGAKCNINNLTNRIDLIKSPIDLTQPYIKFEN